MQTVFALIVPLGGGGEHPAHPIAPGGSPPGIWGPPGPWPTPPIAPGGGPSQGPGFPTHPIAPGGPPPGIWGGPPLGMWGGPIVGPLPPPDASGNYPSLPVNLQPPGVPPEGYGWYMVYVHSVGWIWVLLPVKPAVPPETPPTTPPPTPTPV